MAQVLYDPENETKPWQPIKRLEMRSLALRRKQRGEVANRRAIVAAEKRKATLASRQAYLEMLAEEAVKAKAEILARKAATKAAAEAAGFCVLERPFPIVSKFDLIELRAMQVFRLTQAQIRGNSRDKKLVFARQFVMYWVRRLTHLSQPQIGRKLGDRDHTTVLHGCRAYVDKRKAMGRTLRPAR